MQIVFRYGGATLIAVLALSSTVFAASSLPATYKFAPNEAVDAVFARFDSTASPGCAAAAAKDGELVYSRGYGMANLDHGVPITPQTPFHVASLSKQFTAASILLLALEGKVSLDDDVRKYLPELPDFGATITLRHLIHHTSGLRDQWDLLGLAGWKYSFDLITDDDVLRLMTKQRRLNFAPNSRYLYSNTGYTLLAIVVKRVSGQSLREFTTERIFEPLGMHHTHFRDDHAEIVPGFANGYERAGDSFRTRVTNFNTAGATSLLSTPEDLLRWDENFYTGRVGGRAFTELMLERAVLNDGSQLAYASGVLHDTYRGLRAVDHSGSDAGYRSYWMQFPEQHFGIAVVCNIAEARAFELTKGIANAFLAAQLRPLTVADGAAPARPVKVSAKSLRDKAGIYLNRVAGRSVRIVERDGQLLELDDEGTPRPLIALGGSRFRFSRLPWVIEFSGGDEPRRLTLEFSARESEVLDWVPAFAPTEAELEAFAGLFASDELDVRYRVRVKNGALLADSQRRDSMTLEPITKDVFDTELGVVTFSRAADGKIDGLSFTTSRAWGNEFRRMTE